MLLVARDEIARLTMRELLELTPERFAAVFKGTAIKRVKLAGLLRNTCIVAGNAGAIECIDLLVRLAAHNLAMVRVHAVWAVFTLVDKTSAANLLAEARAKENAPEVLAEYAWWADAAAS